MWTYKTERQREGNARITYCHFKVRRVIRLTATQAVLDDDTRVRLSDGRIVGGDGYASLYRSFLLKEYQTFVMSLCAFGATEDQLLLIQSWEGWSSDKWAVREGSYTT